MRAISDAMHQEIDAINGSDLPNEELDQRCGQVFKTLSLIADRSAESLDDVVVKLQELEYVIETWGLNTEWHEPLLHTAREGVAHLLRRV